MDNYGTPEKKITLSRSELQAIYTLVQRTEVYQMRAESIQRPIAEWCGKRDLDVIELVEKFKRPNDALTTEVRDSLENNVVAKARATYSAQRLWATAAPSAPGSYPVAPLAGPEFAIQAPQELRLPASPPSTP
ncbi:hypothetical protein HO133_009195 [Letharia lupina]|uniref:Uncharacterized protein n=2 Tax=Letharia TaxID=112415 RepID=A0A8H6CN73_9LECA|nr:uncharacterized protein HO133_009195 [Letharia lupina]XP_037166813.1 uncharacterized protein HO173_004379 [Letharia columbiana]KAF6226329.1 hypothetical protein HO133_009195 [Letharia lupina]KAF6237489.1 hypothetical protein HO173_004379 [Letharia columbiana]